MQVQYTWLRLGTLGCRTPIATVPLVITLLCTFSWTLAAWRFYWFFGRALTLMSLFLICMLRRGAGPGAAHKGIASYAAPAGSSAAPCDGCASGCLGVTRRPEKCIGFPELLADTCPEFPCVLPARDTPNMGERNLSLSPPALKRRPRPYWVFVASGTHFAPLWRRQWPRARRRAASRCARPPRLRRRALRRRPSRRSSSATTCPVSGAPAMRGAGMNSPACPWRLSTGQPQQHQRRVLSCSSLRRAGEFEKHQHCWMGWPDSPYLWRENAKPAQEQYAAVAKAISQFEPLIMLTNPEVCAHMRTRTCSKSSLSGMTRKAGSDQRWRNYTSDGEESGLCRCAVGGGGEGRAGGCAQRDGGAGAHQRRLGARLGALGAAPLLPGSVPGSAVVA